MSMAPLPVSTQNAYLVRGEARVSVHGDLKHAVGMMQFQYAQPPQIPVRIIALSERQSIRVGVTLDIYVPIIQEPTNLPSSTFILIYYQY